METMIDLSSQPVSCVPSYQMFISLAVAILPLGERTTNCAQQEWLHFIGKRIQTRLSVAANASTASGPATKDGQ